MSTVDLTIQICVNKDLHSPNQSDKATFICDDCGHLCTYCNYTKHPSYIIKTHRVKPIDRNLEKNLFNMKL